MKEVSPEEFLQVDVRKFASEEVKNQRIAAERTNMYNKRTDWDNEEVKAQGDAYRGLFKCESCGQIFQVSLHVLSIYVLLHPITFDYSFLI